MKKIDMFLPKGYEIVEESNELPEGFPLNLTNVNFVCRKIKKIDNYERN